MDWVIVLKEEARRNPVILAEDFEKRFGISPASLRKALGRLESRGFVERVTHKIYVNRLALDVASTDLVNVIRPRAYVSLESALRYWGISTQSPAVLTCVGLGKPREYRGESFALQYRTISPKLYWGFQEKQTRYGYYKLAEPEKALLDWIYLCLQEGVKPPVDELNMKPINRSKLIQYASRYPSTVLNFLVHAIAMEEFAA
jgi:predicted transcriptional regulator of viral defense system